MELMCGGDGGRCRGGGKLRGANRREGLCTTQVVGLQSHVLVIDAQT